MLLIDTSSWVSMVRYYLPHDKGSTLKDLLIRKLDVKEIIIIDKVYSECKGVCQKIVVNTLPFLKEYKVSTEDYVANTFFHNLLVNHLSSPLYRELADEFKEIKKIEYTEGADCKLVLFALGNREVRPIIVTEESQLENDVKHFKKITTVCQHPDIKIPTISLPQMIDGFDEINFQIVKR